MSTSSEELVKTEARPMPPFGTPDYFEYLRDFQPSDEHLSNPKQFISETMAATSLALMIRRNRTYWPLGNLQTADMDSRLFHKAPQRPEFFMGSVGVRANLPIPNRLKVHAQHQGRSYDLVIPVTDTYLYDQTGHIYAAYNYSELKPQIYNEMAAPEYDEHDLEIFFRIIRYAAIDSLDVLHHIHGPINKTTYPEAAISWHDDYLNDDPDELAHRPSRIRKVMERLRQINSPWRPDYLNDDPDEFLKAV